METIVVSKNPRIRCFQHIDTRLVVGTSCIVLVQLLFGLLLVSCIGDVCGDIWDRSPTQLLDENDEVLLARFESVDTLIQLGRHDYLGSMDDFKVFAYSFSSLKIIQTENGSNRLVLWKCERTNTSYPTTLPFEVGDTVLIYGKLLQSKAHLPLVMAPMAPEEDLLRVIKGHTPRLDWKTRSVDSLLATTIVNSSMLQARLISEQQSGTRVVYCPEGFCLTMEDFYDGRLCYYDSASVGHSVTSAEYLAELEEVANLRSRK